MSKFAKKIKDSIDKSIDHKTTIRTGEITVDNGDGTYDVKISQSDSAYPDVETMYYNAVFSVGEIVDIGFEYGCKESPKIMGHSKTIAQEPKEVEVDYSGGGTQTVTTTVYSEDNDGFLTGSIDGESASDKDDSGDDTKVGGGFLIM